MAKSILKIVSIFIIGICGGIFADQILGPYLAEKPLRSERSLASVSGQTGVDVKAKNDLTDTIGKVEKAIIRFQTKSGTEGTGIVVTSDGLVVTLAEFIPQGANLNFYIDDKAVSYQVLKRDLKKNLALVKLEGKNLQTFGFANFDNIKQGQEVFLMGFVGAKNDFKKIVNKGIIRAFDSDIVQTNIIEKNDIKGSPLFNIGGELLGLNFVDSDGKISAIPVLKIKEFIGL